MFLNERLCQSSNHIQNEKVLPRYLKFQKVCTLKGFEAYFFKDQKFVQSIVCVFSHIFFLLCSLFILCNSWLTWW